MVPSQLASSVLQFIVSLMQSLKVWINYPSLFSARIANWHYSLEELLAINSPRDILRVRISRL